MSRISLEELVHCRKNRKCVDCYPLDPEEAATH
jgi:hypothetical protein